MNETDDSKNTGQGPEPDRDDRDLAALFGANEDSTPDFLDQRILAAAREAVVGEDAGYGAGTGDSDVIQHDQTRSERASSGRYSRWQTSGRWVAMAASVMLAVTVVPLMLRSPDSGLQQDIADSPSMKAVAESVSLPADSIAPEADTGETGSRLPSRSSMRQETAPLATTPAPIIPAIQARKRSSLADERVESDESLNDADTGVETESGLSSRDDAGSPTAETAAGEDFRHNPQDWIEHIRQLQDDDRYDDALAEYELFRRQFPKHEPDFSVPLRP